MDKENAIIVDLDGTLCNVDHRLNYVEKTPKEWKKFHENLVHDNLNHWCYEIIKGQQQLGYKVILLTGRDDTYREETQKWLLENDIKYDLLLMRDATSWKEDSDVKKEFYQKEIQPFYQVLFVIEDRLSVVKMWREIGVTCLQCAWGDF